MITATSISNALLKEGLPVHLFKGKGYFYFEYDQGRVFEAESVYTCHINSFSKERWIKMGRDFAAKVRKEQGLV